MGLEAGGAGGWPRNVEHRLGPREELPGLAPSLISQAPPVSQTPLWDVGQWWDLGKGLRVGFGTQEISVMLIKVVKTPAFSKWLRISGKLLKMLET